MGISSSSTANRPVATSRFPVNPYYPPDLSSPDTANLLNEFTFKSFYMDPYFQECKVLEHRLTKELIILKQLQFASESEMELHYSAFQNRRMKLINPHVLRLRCILPILYIFLKSLIQSLTNLDLAKKQVQGMLKDSFAILLFFDYVLISLYNEVNTRIKLYNPFSAEQLRSLIVGCTTGYAFLESQGMINNKVRPTKIYFGIRDQLPIVKVTDSELSLSQSNYDSIRTHLKSKEDIYLAPEEVEALQKAQHPPPTPKSGVFSLGMCLLQASLLLPCRELYDYESMMINFSQIEQRLLIVRNRYPLEVYTLLQLMLEKSIIHRPTFSQLFDKVSSIYKVGSTDVLNLSSIPRQSSSIYIRNTILHPDQFPFMQESRSFKNSGIVTSQMISPNQQLGLHEVDQVYTNGNAYTGTKNAQGQRHGKGRYTYADGCAYEGDWVNNRIEGQGTLYFADGTPEYEGQWKNDMFDGTGVLNKKEGDWTKYEGEFRSGRVNGQGTITYADSNTHAGHFVNGQMIKPKVLQPTVPTHIHQSEYQPMIEKL